jgi:hypothetical protein
MVAPVRLVVMLYVHGLCCKMLNQVVYIVTTGLYRLDRSPYFDVRPDLSVNHKYKIIWMRSYQEGWGSSSGGNTGCDAVKVHGKVLGFLGGLCSRCRQVRGFVTWRWRQKVSPKQRHRCVKLHISCQKIATWMSCCLLLCYIVSRTH